MRCTAKNAQGLPCRAFALGGSRPARCAAHATGKAAERHTEASREGGRQRMRQVDRKPTREAPENRLECRADILRAMRDVHTRIACGELAARDGSVMLTALRDMLPMVPEGPAASRQFLALFVRVHMLGEGAVGETQDGLRVPFTPEQVEDYKRAFAERGAEQPAEIRVRRNGRYVDSDEPEVVFDMPEPYDALPGERRSVVPPPPPPERSGSELPELVYDVDTSPEKEDEALEWKEADRRPLPVMVINRRTKSDPIN